MRISLSKASIALRLGKVVAIPTETVYGLAACLDQLSAIESIFVLKKRSLANPLIIHVATSQDIDKYVPCYPPDFEKLAEAFWPGPLTMILSTFDTIPTLVRAGLPTAAFRMPAHDLTLSLLQKTGPLVMPSANLSGRPSATRPEHVEEDFGKNFPLLDGGHCTTGVESTIILYQHPIWKIARLGALAPERFKKILGYEPPKIQQVKGEKPLCPGQMFRHYAPRAHLFLGGKADLEKAQYILGFKHRIYPLDKQVIFLGSDSCPEEVAENLYHILRQLDFEGADNAWVDMDFPQIGLWQTIAERLLRAGEI